MQKVMTPEERLEEELARLEGKLRWLYVDRKHARSEQEASMLNHLIMRTNQQRANVSRQLRLGKAS